MIKYYYYTLYYKDYEKQWFKNNRLHRVNGPAVERFNGSSINCGPYNHFYIYGFRACSIEFLYEDN